MMPFNVMLFLMLFLCGYFQKVLCSEQGRIVPKEASSSDDDSQSSTEASSSDDDSQSSTEIEEPPRYFVFHTLGIARIGAGDRAYVDWLNAYPQSTKTGAENCLGSFIVGGSAEGRSVLQGRNVSHKRKRSSDNDKKKAEAEAYSKDFSAAVIAELSRYATLPVTLNILVHLNIRFLGNVQGHTGRGVNKELIKNVGEAVKNQYKKNVVMRIVITVHELTEKSAVTLQLLNEFNSPEIYVDLHRYNNRIAPLEGQGTNLIHYIPLPNFVYNEYSYDEVARLLRVIVDSQHGGDAENIYRLRQWLYGAAFTIPRHAPLALVQSFSPNHGILIFGSISKHHGYNEQNIKALIASLKSESLPPEFKVILAGRAGRNTDSGLLTGINELNEKEDRFVYEGELPSNYELDKYLRTQYAISFDDNGRKENASAQNAVICAGMLLFTRNEAENDLSFVNRVKNAIMSVENEQNDRKKAEQWGILWAHAGYTDWIKAGGCDGNSGELTYKVFESTFNVNDVGVN